MKTLSLIAQKGGTGKTTLAIHLCVQAVRDGLSVVLVDVDPQASASTWWQRRAADEPALVQGDGDELTTILSQARERGYGLAIIDTAPHSSEQATACAQASDWIYIPTRPAILDLDAIGASTTLAAAVQAPARIVLNACPPPTRFFSIGDSIRISRSPTIAQAARNSSSTFTVS